MLRVLEVPFKAPRLLGLPLPKLWWLQPERATDSPHPGLRVSEPGVQQQQQQRSREMSGVKKLRTVSNEVHLEIRRRGEGRLKFKLSSD